MHEVHLSQGTIDYREDGTGEPLLFVHGVLVDGDLWRGVVPRLAKDFRCIVPDWPFGSHRTPLAPDADLSPPALARMVVDFMDALGLESATLVGNDTGGAICQLVATEHPDRVSRLVLTSCDVYDRFPPPPFKPLGPITKIPGSVWLIAQSLRPRLAQRLPIAFGWVTKKLPDKALADKWLTPVRTSRGVRRDVGKIFRAIDPRYTIEAAEKLERFDKPVLLAWATEDKLFPVEYARRLAAAVPDATLEEIPDSYTFVPHDQPERLAEVIAAFVRRPAAVSA
ncbi:MAG TPA: alpha/beta hydrolase [Thermoleophilaceae bacterium]|nr:alpha/beta hydrolase [Thermoleophilaceae bacterium]